MYVCMGSLNETVSLLPILICSSDLKKKLRYLFIYISNKLIQNFSLFVRMWIQNSINIHTLWDIIQFVYLVTKCYKNTTIILDVVLEDICKTLTVQFISKMS